MDETAFDFSPNSGGAAGNEDYFAMKGFGHKLKVADETGVKGLRNRGLELRAPQCRVGAL